MNYSEVLLERMADIDCAPNDLVHKYYDLLAARGVRTTVESRRNMVYRILNQKTKPDISTFNDLVKALGGDFDVKWS